MKYADAIVVLTVITIVAGAILGPIIAALVTYHF
jgi:hypothetical protein